MSFGPWRPDQDGRVHKTQPRERRERRTATILSRTSAVLGNVEDQECQNWRLQVLAVGLVGLFGLLLLGFWRLQIVHSSHYRELAQGNVLRSVRLRPTRGLILDRNGEILATNRPAYEVALVRENLTDLDATLQWLSDVLGQPAGELEARLDRHQNLPQFRPVVIADGVPLVTVATIEARRLEHPGVVVQVQTKRDYPHGQLAAHVLGHVGEISRRQLDDLADRRFRMGDIIGQDGIERRYNDELAGHTGERLTVVNSAGREVRVLHEQPPQPGMTIMLSLDWALQQRAEALLSGRAGAIVLLDVRSAEILAMVSAPTYDPNAFSARFTSEDWRQLTEDPRKPLQNRSLRASYPPGSTFKLIMAVAGLEQQVVSPTTTVFCPGGRTLFGRFYNCLGQHGNVHLQQALSVSCNSYFYELGVRLGRSRIVQAATQLGLGERTGVDLPSEEPGLLPSQSWLDRQQRRWYPGETVSVSIGQGPLNVTPLQMAQAAAIIATGFDYTPHLMTQVEEPSSTTGGFGWSMRARPAALRLTTRESVLAGMASAVEQGTARRALVPTIQIGGKTGTAQVVRRSLTRDVEEIAEHLRNHAWFVGVAPINEPEVAIAVLVEHGGSGGTVAAPLAGQLLTDYFGVATRPPTTLVTDPAILEIGVPVTRTQEQ